jgi:NAD(P) transhydrogenase subunit alpha
MGAQFIFLDFIEEQQGGPASGGYASPSSPQFREKQLEKFRELAPAMDIVITTALIPGRDAPKLWLADMVAAMKPGSVIIDLAAERGGNCDLTVADRRIVSQNGVVIIGYTDFPSRMAAQSSMLYSTNIRHMIADLPPAKDGNIVHNMQDDVIRGATVVFGGELTFPPPPPKIRAIAPAKPTEKPRELTPAEKRALEVVRFRKATRQQVGLLLLGGLFTLLIGVFAPPAFMGHFIVFALACFVGFQVIWGVSHALHTPLMAVTNAISGIIIIGALLQITGGGGLVTSLAAVSVAIAAINIVGGFMVTHRMLNMFRKS